MNVTRQLITLISPFCIIKANGKKFSEKDYLNRHQAIRICNEQLLLTHLSARSFHSVCSRSYVAVALLMLLLMLLVVSASSLRLLLTSAILWARPGCLFNGSERIVKSCKLLCNKVCKL